MDNERNIILWQAPIFAAGAAVSEYFALPGDRPIQVKEIGYILFSAGADADETVTIDVDHSSDGFSVVEQVGAVSAAIDVGSTPTIVAKDSAIVASEINERLPAGGVLRITLTPAGTTPTFRVYPFVTYNTL